MLAEGADFEEVAEDVDAAEDAAEDDFDDVDFDEDEDFEDEDFEDEDGEDFDAEDEDVEDVEAFFAGAFGGDDDPLLLPLLPPDLVAPTLTQKAKRNPNANPPILAPPRYTLQTKAGGCSRRAAPQ